MSARPASPQLSMVGEATLLRRLRAALPVFVLFRSRQSPACRALAEILARLAPRYAEQAAVLSVDAERAPMLAEQYGVAAAPTLLALHHHDELARLTGFAPEPLVQLFFNDVLTGALEPGRIWSPVEQAFEDAVIIPLLEGWGWRYGRQVACPPHPGQTVVRGRIDILVYDGAAAPLTLFEAKRQIATSAALRQACAQASGYAQALALGSFVVAAPAGMWVYRQLGAQARLEQACTSLEVASRPELVQRALLRASGT